MSKIDMKAYIENLLSRNVKLKKYKKFEELTIVNIDKTGAYPIAICKNQAGKLVKIGVTFLKLYYLKTKNDTFVLESKENFRAMPVHQKITFVSSEGQTFRLKPGDYIVIDAKNNFFGETKENFEENYISPYKYAKAKASLLEF